MAKNAVYVNHNGAPASAASAESEVKKQMKSFAVYVAMDGEGKEVVTNSPAPSATIVRTEFSNGVKREIDTLKLSRDVLNCAILQGLATRVQRSYQAIKDIDGVIEAYDETVADLYNGVWIEGRTGEPRVTMLSEAIVLSLEANGATVDEARKLSIIEKLKTAEAREKAMANDQVKAFLADLKLKAAQARAKEAKAQAKVEGASKVDALGF